MCARDKWVYFLVLPPLFIVLFLFVIISMTGSFVFTPSKDFFKILIQLATALIVFGGTLTIFTVSQIETLISELRAEITKIDKEIALGPKYAPQAPHDPRPQYDPKQVRRTQYDESIGRWSTRVRKVVTFLMIAILPFIASIIISLAYISIDPNTITNDKGAIWGLSSLLFIGVGIDLLLYLVTLIEPLKSRR